MMGLSSNRLRGFTLIEALVALLVLSIGMLGVAAMQLKSLQGAHAAYQRSYATLIAVDAQERVWKEFSSDQECPSDIAQVSTDWKGHWFPDMAPFADAGSVIRDKDGSGSDLPKCEYQAVVSWKEERLSDAASEFVYKFRLPEIN
ncbi:type IV pilus modification protein PilV [uncultured Halomonas sp.]|uniref:type IV pilus modification protein PilV n=1 Tax=uncultured Halomonas sp. TaxID=173971 RepID=UPI00261DC5F6|nr:type IV pilus modification protein PilV [uncultured Halomonas sp.]